MNTFLQVDITLWSLIVLLICSFLLGTVLKTTVRPIAG